MRSVRVAPTQNPASLLEYSDGELGLGLGPGVGLGVGRGPSEGRGRSKGKSARTFHGVEDWVNAESSQGVADTRRRFNQASNGCLATPSEGHRSPGPQTGTPHRFEQLYPFSWRQERVAMRATGRSSPKDPTVPDETRGGCPWI